MKESKLFIFKLSVTALILCAVSSCILLTNYTGTLSWLLLGATAVFSIMVIVEFIIMRSNIHRYISNIDAELDMTQRHALTIFPSAIIIINQSGTILWYNRSFEKEFYSGYDEPYGADIRDIIHFDLDRLLKRESLVVSYGEKNYRMLVTVSRNEVSSLFMLCLEDVTDYVKLQERFRKTRPCVIMMVIDNYDDLLQNAKESDKTYIAAELEKILEKFMEPTTGILRKLGSDRFIAVVEEQHIINMLGDKFKILDMARKIMVGDKNSLTLSIGVGRSAETVQESELFARQALDMALSRGGDQAAVKNGDNAYEFFGGVSKAIEKQSKTRSRVVASSLSELIHNSEKVFIMGHRFGDLDSIGAACGLAGVIRLMGKQAYVAADISSSLAKPLAERIIRHEKDLFIEIQDALTRLSPETLLIIVDTCVRDFLDSPELYDNARQVAIIDHHRKNPDYIKNYVLELHETSASSASELITELIQYFKLPSRIPFYYAEALLAGIMLDTKGFVMNTGVRTFEAAAYLRKMGADTVTVKKFFAGSFEIYQHRTQLVASSLIYKRCAVTISTEKHEDIRIVAPQAADEMLNIMGVDASFAVYEAGGTMHISARSMGTVNVQLIMEKLGGGGHQNMAAAQLCGNTLDQVKEKLFAAIDSYFDAVSDSQDRKDDTV